MGYDLIGDIHGQAGKLRGLLRALGYTPAGAGWRPPQGRTAVFVGDLIDRGPEQVEVVRMVRAMVDSGHALALMGNHELNAIGYITPCRDDASQFLRRLKPANVSQHAEFLRQVGADSPLHHELVAWFRTLPLALDLGGLRAVHAWWHEPYVEQVRARHAGGQPMDENFLHAAFTRGSPEWTAVEGLTKGLEVRLPEGHGFEDHGGVVRHEVRTRWWEGPQASFRQVALVGAGQEHRVPDIALPAGYLGRAVQGAPVFVGHYWMQGRPVLQNPKLACLDWSAAKDGPVVAYRWHGEAELQDHHLVWSHG